MCRILFCSIIFLTCFINILRSQDVDQALTFYSEGKYKESLQEWKELLNNGAKGEDIYYNMGNTYFKLGEYPEAILFFEKALVWNPYCTSCKKNLQLSNEALGIEYVQFPEFIVIKWIKNLLGYFNPLVWFILFSVFTSGSIILWRNIFQLPNGIIKYKVFFSVCAMLFLLAYFWRNQYVNHQNKVVVIKQTPLYISPDENSATKSELIPGIVLRAKDNLKGWVKVETMEYESGWISEEKLQRVNP
ncbi:MAG: tetratricopeptide repeat protein [Bacteroidota bacterium]|nr:tetratricopeptide repeat protein [Bacteroidota bacterium]